MTEIWCTYGRHWTQPSRSPNAKDQDLVLGAATVCWAHRGERKVFRWCRVFFAGYWVLAVSLAVAFSQIALAIAAWKFHK
jgi:hypothetical protein